MSRVRDKSSSSSDQVDIDHYSVLGLPSGEDGAKLTLKDIEKAYRNQSRIRHPDKRPDDPGATADFQLLTSSFEVLRDESARRAFDAHLRALEASLRARRDRDHRQSLHDTKRRRFASDLEERERHAAAAERENDRPDVAHREEIRVAAELKRELDEFQQARHANKKSKDASPAATTTSSSAQEKVEENGGKSLDKERMLKVSWEREMGDYSAARLRLLFEKFGGVEDVVIRSKSSKRKGSAVVVMSTKEAVALATQNMIGDLSNPLLVLPILLAGSDTSSLFPSKFVEPVDPRLNNIVGAGFKDYEASIMKKLEEAKQKKNNTQS